MKHVAVIGAGPAGMTAAYQLSQAGYSVDVFEADSQVGGLSKSLSLWNQTVDLGPHRYFSNEKRINELWLEVVKKDYVMVDRLTRIFYKNRFFFYPLKPFDALLKLGIWEAIRCVLSYGKYAVFKKPIETDTFDRWVTSRFGKRLFEIFFKTYSEKLWGLNCEQIDADFASQRIKGLTLFGAIWNALSAGKGNKHKTLVDRFAYPIGGTGAVYQKMADHIEENGGKIRLKSRIVGVNTLQKKVTGLKLADGSEPVFDHVISTMPLTHLVNSLPSKPKLVEDAVASLSFRNTILVYLEVQNKDLFPDNWLYVHTPGIKCGRVTNFRNWSKDLYKSSAASILCMEYWCNDTDEIWQLGNEQLGRLAQEEIIKTGLTKDSKISNTYVVRVPRSYPVYKVGYKSHLEPIIDFLDQFDSLIPIGRYGSFKYNNQDHSILMGLLAAENIIAGKKIHDLWNINTDDSYQEESTIDETGLSSQRELTPAH